MALCLALRVLWFQNKKLMLHKNPSLFSSPSDSLSAQRLVYYCPVGACPNQLAPVEPSLLSPVAGRIQMQEAVQATIGIKCESVRVAGESGTLFPPYHPYSLGFAPKSCGIQHWRALEIRKYMTSPSSIFYCYT